MLYYSNTCDCKLYKVCDYNVRPEGKYITNLIAFFRRIKLFPKKTAIIVFFFIVLTSLSKRGL